MLLFHFLYCALLKYFPFVVYFSANGPSSGLPCVYPINNPQDRSHLMARAVSWESFDTDNDIFSWHSSYLHPVQPTGMFSRQITLGSNPVYENDEDEY